MLEWRHESADDGPVAPTRMRLKRTTGNSTPIPVGGERGPVSFNERYHLWLNKEPYPHAHGELVHEHTKGRRRHRHTRLGEWYRRWMATDLQPHAHGDQIHAHTWGRQRHDHGGMRWGR